MPCLSINIKLNGITINIDFLIFILIIVSFVAGFFIQYIVILTFIILHETGHIITAVNSGASVYRLRVLPIGLNAEIDDSRCSKYGRILIYLVGPLTNLSFAILLYLIYACHSVSNELIWGVYTNIWLAFFNLLPILPLDGGKIVFELLAGHFGMFKAGKQMNILSLVISILMICFGVVIFKYTPYNASIILIGIYIFFCIKQNNKETALMNIKSFISKRSRFIAKGIYPARHIVVRQNVKLLDVIKIMDYSDMFHIVEIIDKDMHIIGVMTEQEIVDSLVLNSMDITFETLFPIIKK